MTRLLLAAMFLACAVAVIRAHRPARRYEPDGVQPFDPRSLAYAAYGQELHDRAARRRLA